MKIVLEENGGMRRSFRGSRRAEGNSGNRKKCDPGTQDKGHEMVLADFLSIRRRQFRRHAFGSIGWIRGDQGEKKGREKAERVHA
jgi:hypothetical protein